MFMLFYMEIVTRTPQSRIPRIVLMSYKLGSPNCVRPFKSDTVWYWYWYISFNCLMSLFWMQAWVACLIRYSSIQVIISHQNSKWHGQDLALQLAWPWASLTNGMVMCWLSNWHGYEQNHLWHEYTSIVIQPLKDFANVLNSMHPRFNISG